MQNTKANRTNSFRLHRISKANSVKKHSQTFYNADESFKMASINSVTKGVKHSDTTYLTGKNLHKLRKQPLDGDDAFYQAAHINLTEVRKKYDDIKKQRVQKDENILRLKEQINKYNIFQGQYLDKAQSGKREVERMKNDLEVKKNLVEATIMQKRVLLNMQGRLKSDKVVYDQRKFDMEKQYRFQNKQKEVFKKEGHTIDQSSDRSTKIYNKFRQQLRSQREERQQHIQHLQSMIESKEQCIRSNTARERQIREIAERALQDKNNDEKQWQHIYLTHTFVNKMLRSKIEREMQKFQTVQFAFKIIKTATGVNDAKSLVYKYLNKESVYGDLLGRITANEQRISELKDETQRLHQEEKQLQMEKQTIQNIKVKSIDISSELKEMSIVEEKKKTVETHQNKISQWLLKQFKKFIHIEKVQQKFSIPKNLNELSDSFIRYLELLVKSLGKCEIEEVKEEHTEAGDLSMRDSARVTRVVPKRSRKNSSGEQIFDMDEEETNPIAQNQQYDLINNQREQLLRNNQRFMKQARKKQDQKRRLLVEKMKDEKKEKKAVEVKKEEDD